MLSPLILMSFVNMIYLGTYDGLKRYAKVYVQKN